MKKLILAVAPLALLGCQAKTDDLVEHIVQVKQTTQVNIEPYPEFKPQPAFAYTAATLRSPFQRPKPSQIEVVQSKQANCLQPDFSRKKQALEGYGMDALTVSGIFTSQGKKWALFKASDGSLHKAAAGDFVGLFFGRITSIDDGTVSITEMLPDGAGCWQRKQATLSMASQAGEKENV